MCVGVPFVGGVLCWSVCADVGLFVLGVPVKLSEAHVFIKLLVFNGFRKLNSCFLLKSKSAHLYMISVYLYELFPSKEVGVETRNGVLLN